MPAALKGRVVIKDEDLRGKIFTCDEPAIIRRTPKSVEGPDGDVRTYYDDLLYLPLILKDRPQEPRVLRTNSRELISTIRAIGFVEAPEAEDNTGIMLQIMDQAIEGDLRLCDKDHKYADGKTYKQIYLEEVDG